jgi:chemotaxis protein methyltransferase CheR
MRSKRDVLGLTGNAFTILRDLIHERTGLYYDDGKRDLLADRLAPLVIEHGFHSFLDYYYLLKYNSYSSDEWQRVMDVLAVPETYFWREVDQIHALVNVLIPQYVDEGRPIPIRIWSAACSTGEEPLSIAIALNEAGWFQKAPIEIYGTDASPLAIARAQHGLYRERSFRSLPLKLRLKYFEEKDGQWQIKPEIHARVRWGVANLMVESEIAHLATAPFIFCRNVFIYFSEEAIRKVVDQFYRHMPTPGYLFIGASESLVRLSTGFELQEIGGAFVYVKRDAPQSERTQWSDH